MRNSISLLPVSGSFLPLPSEEWMQASGFMPVSYTHLDVYKRQDERETGRTGIIGAIYTNAGKDCPAVSGKMVQLLPVLDIKINLV